MNNILYSGLRKEDFGIPFLYQIFLVNSICLISIGGFMVLGYRTLIENAQTLQAVNFFAGALVLLATIFFLRKNPRVEIGARILQIVLLAEFIIILLLGNDTYASLLLLAFFPVIAFLLGGVRSGSLWVACAFFLSCGIMGLSYAGIVHTEYNWIVLAQSIAAMIWVTLIIYAYRHSNAALLSIQNTKHEHMHSRIKELAHAQRIAGVGSWSWDVLHDTVQLSDELHRIIGVTQKGFNPTYKGLLNHLYRHDQDAADTAIQNAMLHKISFALDHRMRRADGTLRTFRGRGELVTDWKGNVTHVIGIEQDVTDLIAHEHELRTRAQDLERINNALLSREASILTIRKEMDHLKK